MLNRWTAAGFLFVTAAAGVASGQVINTKDGITGWPAPLLWKPSGHVPPIESSAGEESPRPLHEASASAPLPLVAITPCRIIDTRGNGFTGQFGPPALPAGSPRSFTLTGQCGIAGTAQAVSLNVTVTNTTGPGDIRIYPQGASEPLVSTLNDVAAQTVANAAIVPLGTGGGITIVADVHGANLIVDTNGYYDGTGFPPSGPAGGGLSGTYPNPSVVSSSVNTPNTIVSRNGSGDFSTRNISLAGTLDLPLTSLNAGLVFLGGAPFLHAYGTNNTFLGTGSGNFSLTGSGNTATGYSAITANTAGTFNSAFGAYALGENTTGNYNTGLGAGSLSFNASGSGNVAVGYNALGGNTLGYDNVAVGFDALQNNSTSSDNIAIGRGALFTQSFLNGGLIWNGYNTAVGAGALLFNNPSATFNAIQNTAVGFESLRSNTTGLQNTAVGDEAGNRTGSAAAYGGGTVVYVANTTGNFNTFLGRGTGTTASNLVNCTAVGIDAYCDGSNEVHLGNPFVTSIGGEVGWSALSDARAKKEIEDLGLGLEFVLKLRPVEYKLKTGNERKDMGFVAQDVEALLGEDYNVLTVGGDQDRTLSLRYTDLIAPLVKGMQEQNRLLQEQQGLIEQLRERVQALEAERRP